jgi:benzoyl-CoA reductase subunit A
VVQRIERILKLESVKTKYDSQIAGALGAALFGYTLVKKQGVPAKAAAS